MGKKKFTIDDIERCLKDLGFEWVERYVYNTKKKVYERAKISHFNGSRVFIYIKKKNYYLIPVTISNDKFVVGHYCEKLDASLHWQDLLAERTAVEGV